jgi:purine nucleoside phosphorylase
MKLLEIISVGFDLTDQPMNRFFGGKKLEYNETVHQQFTDFKKIYDSVMREVLYNIIIEFRIPMKLLRLMNVFKWNV